jgi:hypothetical protein
VIPANAALRPDLDQAGPPQDPQMLGDAGLADPESSDEVADGPLTAAKQVEDLPAVGRCECGVRGVGDILP